jgi:hypothetical protein
MSIKLADSFSTFNVTFSAYLLMLYASVCLAQSDVSHHTTIYKAKRDQIETALNVHGTNVILDKRSDESNEYSSNQSKFPLNYENRNYEKMNSLNNREYSIILSKIKNNLIDTNNKNSNNNYTNLYNYNNNESQEAELISIFSYIINQLNGSAISTIYKVADKNSSNNFTNERQAFLSYLNQRETRKLNSKHHNSSALSKNETIKSKLKKYDDYDAKGAKMYICVVLSLYSISLILLLLSRIKPATKKYKEDKDRERAEFLIKSMQEQTVTKGILEQLSNKEYRDKLWSIYLSHRKNSISCSDVNNRHFQNERNTLKNLEKKIETLKKIKIDLDKSVS